MLCLLLTCLITVELSQRVERGLSAESSDIFEEVSDGAALDHGSPTNFHILR